MGILRPVFENEINNKNQTRIITVTVTKSQKFQKATPSIFHRKIISTVKTINGFKTVPVAIETMTCDKRKNKQSEQQMSQLKKTKNKSFSPITKVSSVFLQICGI